VLVRFVVASHVEYRAGRVVPRYVEVLFCPFIRVAFEQHEV
jgi:hypothetical protein